MIRRMALLLVICLMIGVPQRLAAASEEVDQALEAVRQQIDQGRSLEALEALYWLVYRVWGEMPLTVGGATLVESEPLGYGVYDPKREPIYRDGQPVYVYLEPLGYGFDETEDFARFGFTVDLLLLSGDGSVIGGQRDFGRFDFQSRLANLETFLFLEITPTGLPAGAYALEIDVHDKVDGDSARVRFDFEIAG